MATQTFSYAELKLAPPARKPPKGMRSAEAANAEVARIRADIMALQNTGRIPQGYVVLKPMGDDWFDIVDAEI